MKKLPAWFAIFLSTLILCALFWSGWLYISNVQDSLWMLSVTDLEQVTTQASHAFETYLHKDLQNIHSMATIMGKTDADDLEYIKNCLNSYNEILDGSFYSVIKPEEGIIYSDQSEEFGIPISEEHLDSIRKISGSSVTEPYISDINGLSVLACQERFTFADGTPGIVRKSFPVSRVVNEFALSVYDGAGFSYIVNRQGDILIRSIHRDSNHTYQNIFDAISMKMEHNPHNRSVISDVQASMAQGNSGVVRYVTAQGVEFVYAYVPIRETEGWYYITVVPSSVLMEQSHHILNLSQLFVIVIMVGILVAVIVIMLVYRNHKAMQKIQLEVQNRERLFDILTNGTGDAFIMFTLKDKTVNYVSPNIDHLLGVSMEEVRANVEDLWDDKAFYLDFSRKFSQLEMGRSISMERQRTHGKTGEAIWIAITAYRVLIEKDERAIIVFSDRTVEKKREQALMDATDIAEAANRAKSAFLSNMSHDIRTPMNAIIGLCTLIQRDSANPEAIMSHTRKMMASCQHLLGLINDVLDMSKIEAGKVSLNVEEINLAEIVEELVTVIEPQAHAKKQEFIVSAMDVKSEHLLGDKLRINQILINILSNAIKYTPEGGKVELQIHEMPQKAREFAHLRFVVKDNGNGISPEYMGSIFKAFTREVNSNMNKIQGTGLGMAITRNLVDLMEGNISVESELGKGSTFTVDLDLRIQKKEANRKFWEQHGIRRILVADDEQDNCLYVTSVMERVGVKVEYALCGAAALDLAQKEYEAKTPFDLILMDLKMPDMDGIETTRLIRDKIPGNVLILAFTSYDWTEVEEKARAAGINGFMSKPFFLTNFEACVERICHQPDTIAATADGILMGKHILVAEDNEMNSEILRELLDMQGATCDIEENGEKAFQRFLQSSPGEYDFILMDVQMPVMNGYEATRAIRSCAHPQASVIPIFAMTADAFAEDIRHAIESGMNGHLAKPLEMNRLEDAVREALTAKP